MENNEKKRSIISLVFKIFSHIFNIFFPMFKLLSFNKNLKRCKRIVKKWEGLFSKMILRNYILAILSLLPWISSMYGYSFVKNDVAYQNRVYELSKDKSFLSTPKIILRAILPISTDSMLLKKQKENTRIRFFAFFLFSSPMIFLFVFGLVTNYFHPNIMDEKKLKKLLISNGILSQEDASSAVIHSTPVGFLLTITGHSPSEIAMTKRLWSSLNLKVKDWYEDPNQLSVVFFEKSFELKSEYIYDKV